MTAVLVWIMRGYFKLFSFSQELSYYFSPISVLDDIYFSYFLLIFKKKLIIIKINNGYRVIFLHAPEIWYSFHSFYACVLSSTSRKKLHKFYVVLLFPLHIFRLRMIVIYHRANGPHTSHAGLTVICHLIPNDR